MLEPARHVRRRARRRHGARSSGTSAPRDELRTFEIRYRLRGVAVAYDDVVDVNLQVWGDQWERRSAGSRRRRPAPATVVRAWGHPVWVRGDVTIDGRERAPARARRAGAPVRRAPHAVPAQRVHLDRRACGSRAGNGLEKIVAEELADAQAYERDKERIDDAMRHPWRTALDRCSRSASLPALAISTVRLLAVRAGARDRVRPRVRAGAADRHRRPRSSRRCCAQGGEAGSFEFTATLFDLIRRGHYRAAHVTTERSVWGGLRTRERRRPRALARHSPSS